jgi:hypothetical protein
MAGLIQIIRYMFRSYDYLQTEIYTSEINMTGLIQIIRYLFRSYDHLQAEIYTSEIATGCKQPSLRYEMKFLCAVAGSTFDISKTLRRQLSRM